MNGTSVCAILLTRTGDAQWLLGTSFGAESALTFGMKRWTMARLITEAVLILPAAFETPWCYQISAAANAHGIRMVYAHSEHPLASLMQLMQKTGTSWSAIVPAHSPFIDGKIIDACLTILSHSSADYIYGPDYPKGARPLVLRREIVEAVVERILPTHETEDALTVLFKGLPFFQGLGFPAPARLKAPELDLSLTSEQRAVDLAVAVQHLMTRQQPVVTGSIIKQMRWLQITRFRAISRLAHHRPRQQPFPTQQKPGVLCLGFRSEKISGGDTSLSNLLVELSQSHLRPLLATPSLAGSLTEVCRQHGIAKTTVPLLAWPSSVHSEMLLAAIHLARFARRHKAGLIYANNTIVGALGVITAFILGLPVVTRVIARLDHDMLESSMLAFADRIIVPSQYMAVHCQDMGISTERLRVVHEGVESAWFDPVSTNENLRERYGLPDGTPLIGVVSRLDDTHKALDQAIKAASLIVVERPDVHMVICGKTGAGIVLQQTRLEQLIERLELNRHVHLAGFFPDMRMIYPQFDLLLHPAAGEPFGLVLTEAMAVGVPVLAIRGGGIPEQVRHKHTGLLLDSNNPELMARAALSLLNQPSLRLQLGQRAREHVHKNFTSKRFTQLMFPVFDELLQGSVSNNDERSGVHNK